MANKDGKLIYRRDGGLQLVSSASALSYNNVTVSDCGRYLAVIHQGLVNVISIDDSLPSRYIPVVPRSSRPRSVTSTVLGVKFVSISFANSSDEDTAVASASDVFISSPISLVIASTCGVQLYEPYGSSGQFRCSFEFTEPANCLTVLPQMGMVCAGDPQGFLRLYALATPPDPPLELVDRIQGHQCPIRCIESIGDDLIASADESGHVFLWRVERGHGLCLVGELAVSLDGHHPAELEEAAACSSKDPLELNNDPFPCTGVVSYKGLVLTSFGSGHLILFDLINLIKLAEVAAHVAWITGLDVASESGLAVSVSEDSWLHIWQLNPRSDQKISHAFSISIEDRLLVGVRFLNPKGSNLCTAAYDDVYCHLLALDE